MPDMPAFDSASFLERIGDDRELAGELIAVFLRDLPGITQAMTLALQQHNASGVGETAHALKGAAANFSAEPVVALAKRLEGCGRAGDLGDAAQCWQALQPELQRLSHAMRAYAHDSA